MPTVTMGGLNKFREMLLNVCSGNGNHAEYDIMEWRIRGLNEQIVRNDENDDAYCTRMFPANELPPSKIEVMVSHVSDAHNIIQQYRE